MSRYCVFVGRFQPFHNAHLRICQNALDFAEKLIIVVGSYRSPKTIKNPWSFEERKEMIEGSLKEYNGRVAVISLRDFLYSDNTWITALQNSVTYLTEGASDVSLIGHFKDSSSEYLRFFPQWRLEEQPNYFGLNATDLRIAMFEGKDISPSVPDAVSAFVRKYMHTLEYRELRREYEFLLKYRKAWESAPYAPTFVTTDAVIIKSGHVLLVRRKVNPGKGMFALPGGFIKVDEPIFNSCLREVKEETKIDIPIGLLARSVEAEKVFDHPFRSLRGRTITHAYFFNLTGGGPLPKVKGGDDAAEAFWLPLGDLAIHEENFFEDHLHIITHFISKV